MAEILSPAESVFIAIENAKGRRIAMTSLYGPGKVAFVDMDHPGQIQFVGVASRPWSLFRAHFIRDPVQGLIFTGLVGTAGSEPNSEILLIDRRIVLYRIEDSVCRATLEPGGKVSGAEKVASDPRLLDAHWAFFSNADVEK